MVQKKLSPSQKHNLTTLGPHQKADQKMDQSPKVNVQQNRAEIKVIRTENEVDSHESLCPDLRFATQRPEAF